MTQKKALALKGLKTNYIKEDPDKYTTNHEHTNQMLGTGVKVDSLCCVD